MKPSQSFLPRASTIASVIAGVALFTAATTFAQKSDSVSPTEPKVTLCHNGHSITVAQAAVPAHQAHGDTLGPCPSEPNVLLCHGGHTIRVDQNSVQTHLDHGDTLGPCSSFAGGNATESASLARPAATPLPTVAPSTPVAPVTPTEVAICYKGHTVKVAPTAVQTYLSIGAVLGPCNYKGAQGEVDNAEKSGTVGGSETARRQQN